ncbi:hypothetical protein BJF85_08245 [Saccharomonospora sp. CUA-673]|uniref:hypothetical protein n=1 Tax=Saccharomonospora sp. CUA-673 TaxID=1904969 RepID=UPI000962220D|nr:hypothetical protein [Saccharomonospora sp. CUA-673]OLT38689.1 hypothetical protein BJF85_08245 [Saccharomonospora sp. CUA-673]
MPVYDAESMRSTAGKVDGIADRVEQDQKGLRGVEGESPFGEVEDEDDPDRVDAALGSFTAGMQSEFDSARRHMQAASGALRNALQAMSEADATAADNLTMRGEV